MVLIPDGQCRVDVGIRSFQEIRWEDLTNQLGAASSRG